MRRSALSLVVLLVVLAVSTTGCLGLPGDTGRIELISTSTADGWTFEQYRNTAYPCSISGYQTFTVATRTGSSEASSAPLMVWLHGGGAGFFSTSGTPLPDTKQMTEESAATQRTSLLNAGLLARVRADAAGYRLLGVSYCNRDFYSGTGQTDPDNPNLNDDGSPRLTNGMLATKAAIQFTQSALPTTKTLLYGGSAGSIGAYAVAWGLQTQGIAPAGVIGDASVINSEAAEDAYAQGSCTGLNYVPEVQAAFARRVDPQLANPANEVDELVASGRLTVPLLHIWSHGDATTCGTRPMSCTLADGSTATLSVTECTHQPLAAAIDGLGPGSASRNLPLCVSTTAHPGTCDKHVVSIANLTNTDPSSPADYLATILDWADARLADA